MSRWCDIDSYEYFAGNRIGAVGATMSYAGENTPDATPSLPAADSGTAGKLVDFAAGFRVSAYTFELRPSGRLLLEEPYKANVLRGAFGQTFRRLTCMDNYACRERCAHPSVCPYGYIFEPAPPQGAEKLRKNSDIPRPFILRPPLDGREEYGPVQPLRFDLLLFGNARRYLPYFIVTFRELAHTGLGWGRVLCTLERVTVALRENGLPERVVYAADDQLVRNEDGTVDIGGSGDGYGESGELRKIRIEFLTPTILKSEDAMVRRPEFHHLIKRLRDRVNSLAYFYHDGAELPVDFKELGAQAEREVRISSCATHWMERARYSRRRGVTQDQSGFVGVMEYEGNLAPFLPLLRLGEWTHVGKSAVWGQGWYRMVG